MLAQVHKLRKIIVPVLFCAFVVAITSCATQKETALVNDPDAHRNESTLPWYKQEKWETSGQFAGMTDRR